MIGKIIGIIIGIVLFLGIANTIGFLNIPIVCTILKSTGINPGCLGPVIPVNDGGSSVIFGRVDLQTTCADDRTNFKAHIVGTVKNDGNANAKDVSVDVTYTLHFVPLYRITIPIGDVAAGEQKDYEKKFTIAAFEYPDDYKCEVHHG